MNARGALLVLALSFTACGPKVAPAPPGPPPIPLHLEPPCDLAPAAGLAWIIDAKPRAIAEIPALIPAIALVVPETRFKNFMLAHGGIDPRQVQALCIARYKEATLTIARTPIDANRVESAFADRETRSDGRAVDVPNPRVVRLWGDVMGEAQELVIFGNDAVAFAQGKPGPARTAEAFAEGRLKRAVPALQGAALSRTAAVLGDAPVRVFMPGPFDEEMAQGLGGLLRAATAIAASAKFSGSDGGRAHVAVRLVVSGAWGKDAPAAAERLAAAVHLVSESGVGRLFGLDRPLEAPRVSTAEDALVLDGVIDGDALARGLHDAVDAEVDEILRR